VCVCNADKGAGAL